MTADNAPNETVHATPDAELIALLVRLLPKPGEPRVVTISNGQLDLYMTPESASVWKEMMARLDVLAAEHGQEATIAIWDASTVVAHVQGAGQ